MGDTLPSVTLWNHPGTSDKLYRIAVEKKGDGWVVNFAYGRRGSTLKTGTKTQEPVDLDKALKVYEKVLKGQLPPNDGYEIIEGGGGDGIGSVVVTASDQEDLGLRPQLLNPITEDEAEQYLVDDDWCAQEKFNGERMTVDKGVDVIRAANKKGFSIGFSAKIAKGMEAYAMSLVVDGEAIKDTLHAFDLLEIGGDDYRGQTYEFRLAMLRNIVDKGGAVVVAYTAIGTAAKRKLMADLKAANKEGIVFKRLSARWNAGRPASGGSAIKCKFWESASCVVSRVNAKRSIEVALDGEPIGNVTIPPNKAIPSVGQVVEVEYLYVAKVGGSLYQPKYIGPRTDVDPSECTKAQQRIKYKAEDE